MAISLVIAAQDALANEVRGKGQEPFFGRPRFCIVFSRPNCATAFDTHFSEPYGRLFFIAYRRFSISSLP